MADGRPNPEFSVPEYRVGAVRHFFIGKLDLKCFVHYTFEYLSISYKEGLNVCYCLGVLYYQAISGGNIRTSQLCSALNAVWMTDE